jgi:hypothetical protein
MFKDIKQLSKHLTPKGLKGSRQVTLGYKLGWPTSSLAKANSINGKLTSLKAGKAGSSSFTNR